MGQTLSEPVVEKVSDDGQDDRVAFGVSAMQGWRISMEDAHAAVLDLQVESDQDFKAAGIEDRVSFFGVYDGHGGDKVAHFAGENVHKILAKQDAFKSKNFEEALKTGFLATDRAILSDPRYEEEVSGCTASVGLISNTTIYVANAGDSRSVLGMKGEAKALSFDHKPQNEDEKARICAAGGYVDFGRVNGNLALSRAIGDFEFKKSSELPAEKQIVTAFPDVTTHTITDDDEFLVIACDGIWDCQSSQAVIEFVRRGVAAKQELSKIAENMMDNCLASNSETGGVGCDNMTMVIVALLRGKSKDEWYQQIADRVEKGDGPVAPPEYAEFRGPGIHHNQFDEGPDDYDMDMSHNGPGRIIFLGDGKEMMTAEEVDDDEDGAHMQIDEHRDGTDDNRRNREETPGPEAHSSSGSTEASNAMDTDDNAVAAPVLEQKANEGTAKAEGRSSSSLPPNAVVETAIPDKLVPPQDTQQK